MSKTLFAVNTLTSVNVQAYASHLNLMYRIGKDSKDECYLFNGYRMAIDRFRNQAAHIAMVNGYDYVLFLDDDVCVPRNTYELLKAADKDVITPLVYIRGYPFKPMMFKAVDCEGHIGLAHYEDWQEHVSVEKPLLECAAIGCSCCLIKTALFHQVQKFFGKEVPLFHTGTNYTEDVYFCMKAREATNHRLSIFVDTNIHAGHILDPEMVALETRENLLSFYESCDPKLRRESHGDTSEEKLEANINEAKKGSLVNVHQLFKPDTSMLEGK